MRENLGIRTRMLLVAATALIIAAATFGSLLIVRHRLEAQVTENLAGDLAHSANTFRNLEAQRISALERENALLADLPSLKALLTTSDKRTIEDAGVEFWKVSGNDLFALADNQGQVMAAYTQSQHADPGLQFALHALLDDLATRWTANGRMADATLRPDEK